PQAIYLTDASVRSNVAFGIADADIDDAAVWGALEAAQLADFVRGLPDGLETRVGDRGTRLSGGQRQRVGIARALYHDPPVLVMDEATSALDNQTERHVVAAVEALRGERTVIMIAHRLSTVQGCDKLYVFEDGRLVDQGTYDDLEAQSEAFAEIAA
ncbi:ATP-binding cassette domain-containing protein, partial [Rubrivirga sp.]|uniref:ATP-binding cassette domain-containing protein n=1 Tax=Rubrivirga sp. TaxID=1885344 RepID=UPI003C715FAB